MPGYAIYHICSIMVVLLATHVYVLVNALAAEMPPGRVQIIWYLPYLSSGTLKTLVFLRVPELKYGKYRMI